jgi:hypothetical protein
MLGPTVHSLWALGQAYAVAGETESARSVLQTLEELQIVNPGAALPMAILYGLLGDTDRAFGLLENAHQQRQPLLLASKVQPRMDCLRSDPRFEVLLKQLNLL